ncbi:MAG: hypothetical protein V2A58_10335 [Planctomycetota bacterium]
MEPSDFLRDVEKRMKPGVISLRGFLGDDARPLEEILAADDAAIRRLGLTHERIAERLAHFTHLALAGYGTPMREADFEVVADEARGYVRSPFGDLQRFRKGEIRLTNLATGDTLTWTPLLVHMIRNHGFYEGKGAVYRLDPDKVKRVLQL